MGWQLDDGTPVHVFGQHKFKEPGDYIVIELEELQKVIGEPVTNVLFMRSKVSNKQFLIGTELRKEPDENGSGDRDNKKS